jgi:hypothetical protein
MRLAQGNEQCKDPRSSAFKIVTPQKEAISSLTQPLLSPHQGFCCLQIAHVYAHTWF